MQSLLIECLLNMSFYSNVIWPNVCWSNVYLSNICWKKVLWSSVFYSNVFGSNFFWSDVCDQIPFDEMSFDWMSCDLKIFWNTKSFKNGKFVLYFSNLKKLVVLLQCNRKQISFIMWNHLEINICFNWFL